MTQITTLLYLSDQFPVSSFHGYAAINLLQALVFFLINNTSCVSPELDSYSSNTPDRMSGRRSPSRQSISPSITDEQINVLMAKLEAVLPEARLGISRRVGMRATSYCVQVSARVLQETCSSYLRSLHREEDDLSQRLSGLLAMADVGGAEAAAIIRSLLM
ncbi:hypothetical protein B296_00011299 [Ensete ventricosum]|uniref:Uncharacterized protein n=1 Tax=Ensete ventricosum TaxID=4639 RepID=A0A426Z8T7_ENSVE|nr:hypothetical protein B296_00011299 [Ensete ventricosum]